MCEISTNILTMLFGAEVFQHIISGVGICLLIRFSNPVLLQSYLVYMNRCIQQSLFDLILAEKAYTPVHAGLVEEIEPVDCDLDEIHAIEEIWDEYKRTLN